MSRRALVLAHLSSCKPATREMFFGGAGLHDHGGAAAGAETQHQQEHSPAPHSAVQFESPPRETTLMPACHSDANMDAAEVGRAWTYNGVRAERSGQQLLLQDMVAMGREELLMKEAEVQKNIVFKANNRDRVGLTTTELSYLHQQLQGITTTCTLIIGFAMASLSADLLNELGDDTGSFCVYKSLAATILSALFIILTTTCICACFTIIACVNSRFSRLSRSNNFGAAAFSA